jgi:uncharacterized protein YfcZ (UPF0381/DUF406 family)
MSLDEEQVIYKIATNLTIIEKSLKMAYSVMNFEYLSYFLNNTQASYEYQNILHQKAKVKESYFEKIKQKIQEAESVTQEMQKQITQVTDNLKK